MVYKSLNKKSHDTNSKRKNSNKLYTRNTAKMKKTLREKSKMLQMKYKGLNKTNKFKKPVKSSFKKTSRKLKVNWSPDVKQIERPNSFKKSIKTPKNTTIYLKMHKDKTFSVKGILHASYLSKKRPIVVLTLFDTDQKMISKTNIDIKNKNIPHITTKTFNIKKNGKSRVRVLFKLGDIIWCHENKQVQRLNNCQGFDLSWLQEMHEFQAEIMRKY